MHICASPCEIVLSNCFRNNLISPPPLPILLPVVPPAPCLRPANFVRPSDRAQIVSHKYAPAMRSPCSTTPRPPLSRLLAQGPLRRPVLRQNLSRYKDHANPRTPPIKPLASLLHIK